jgi:hypothetical protein
MTEEWIHIYSNLIEGKSVSCDNSDFSEIIHFNAHHTGRRMFSCTGISPVGANSCTSSEELITYGSGSGMMMPGDHICALQGSSLPAILRRGGDRCVLIGTAIVPQIMLGEAMKNIKTGEEAAEAFFYQVSRC